MSSVRFYIEQRLQKHTGIMKERVSEDILSKYAQLVEEGKKIENPLDGTRWKNCSHSDIVDSCWG
jgi:hypothetical protein